MTPDEFMDYCTDEQESEAIRHCKGFKARADNHREAWAVFPEWGRGGSVAYGPGHVLIDDYNWHCVDWCMDKAAEAIRKRLDGDTEEYDFLSLTQLAMTRDFLAWLKRWMEQFPKPADSEQE